MCKKLNFNIIWKNKGLKEIGIDSKSKKVIIKINSKYMRSGK